MAGLIALFLQLPKYIFVCRKKVGVQLYIIGMLKLESTQKEEKLEPINQTICKKDHNNNAINAIPECNKRLPFRYFLTRFFIDKLHLVHKVTEPGRILVKEISNNCLFQFYTGRKLSRHSFLLTFYKYKYS